MMPAANRGVGGDIHFPDVCKTPVPPPVTSLPLPYPNLALNAMALGFSLTVFWSFVPALNLSSVIVMSTGDEPGALGGIISGIIKGPQRVTVGNPVVFVNFMPAKNLLCPSSSNANNAPLGACLIPSLTNVLLCCQPIPAPDCDPSRIDLAQLCDALRTTDRVTHPLDGRLLYVRPAAFALDTPSWLRAVLARASRDGLCALVMDLRGNPGGDVRAALDLADDFLPIGMQLAVADDGDGDRVHERARRGDTCDWPMIVMIDGDTASSAELFAAALQYHGRALLVGARSAGKYSAQGLATGSDGQLHYATVRRYDGADGRALPAGGLRPDVVTTTPSETMQLACDQLRSQLDNDDA